MRGVLGETAIAHLAIAELALYNPEHMLDLRPRAAEPSIAGTLPDCQPLSRRGLFLHRPKHARSLGSALPGTAGVALIAIHRGVVIPDQTVHHRRIVHAAAERPSRDRDRIRSARARAPNSGLVVMPDIFMTTNGELVFALARQARLPSVGPLRVFAEAG